MRARLSYFLVATLVGGCLEPTLAPSEPTPDEVPRGPDGTAPSTGPYPIVLAHGMFGARSYFNIFDYWSTIPQALEAAGNEVFITEVDPLNTPMVRGERLIEQLEEIVEATGSGKVILLGHSQGGLDIRYVASTRPDLVATVVSMASPHYGTPAIQLAVDILDDGGLIVDAVSFIEDLFGPIIYTEHTDDSDVYASLHSMTVEGAAAFAAAYPDSSEVAYFSVTGVTDNVPMDHPHCTPDLIVPFVERWANERDPASFPLSIPEALIDDDGLLESNKNAFPNDGLLRAIDGRWGTFLGCIPADHAEELGMVSGLIPAYHPGCSGVCFGTTDTAQCDCNDFEYETFWVELVDWLRSQGY